MPTKRTSKTSVRTLNKVAFRRDRAALELLLVLSDLLVSAGLTPKRFAELAKWAFVQSAASKARLRNGRINQSKVAVLTGLPRNEVKRLLTAKGEATDLRMAQLTPVERVIAAWLSKGRYISPTGIPKRLRVSGNALSFEDLARTHGGDVTVRALLDETIRLGVVQLADRGMSVALTLGPKSEWNRSNVRFEGALPLIIEIARASASLDMDAPRSSISQLRLHASNPLELSILRERLAPAIATFVNGLKESLRVKGAKSEKDAKYELRLNVLLTESAAQKRKKPSARVDRRKGTP